MSEIVDRPAAVPHSAKISALVLAPSESDSDSSLSRLSSSPSSASVLLKGFIRPSSDKDFELPTHQESAAALEFMGFTQATAEEIYQRWETRPDPEQNPYSLLDYATGEFESRNQGDMSHDDFMTKIGLKKEFRDAILDPQFASIFETETLKFWIEDTLASRYHTIGSLQHRLRNLPTDSSGFERGGGPPIVPAQDPTESLSISAITEFLNVPNFIRIGAPAAALDDHLTLYKGCFAITNGDAPFIEPDGSINLTGIDTLPGGDFNARKLASYWTPEQATAEIYRAYAEKRNRYVETWIISIQVPNGLMQTLRKMSLWYSADWKEYVWLCRKKALVPPSKFDELSNAQVIEGHICRKLQHIVARVRPENVQRTINEDFCLMYEVGNGQWAKCSQQAFFGDDTMVQLSRAVRGKVHVDVHASSMLKEPNA